MAISREKLQKKKIVKSQKLPEVKVQQATFKTKGNRIEMDIQSQISS